ncbi:hypothetical protein [Mesobacillus zeae]|uniref:hypothetical protein n=1 Tax=Mesobacillus zeae TaxID=1917180 RepID=UPI00300BDB0B
MKYSKSELLIVAKKHKKYITSANHWNKYATKNQLPRAMTFAYHFGSWNKFKSIVFKEEVKLNDAFTSTYTKNELETIALENKDYFTKIRTWDQFVDKNNLPASNVYIHVFKTWNQAKQIVFNDEKRLNKIRYTRKQLISVALKNKNHFISIKSWNNYAREHSLPVSRIYENQFGNWNKAKETIFGNAKDIIIAKPPSLSIEDLLKIAITNIHYFKSKKTWDLFAVPNRLPRAETFANRFGTWSRAKEIVQGLVKS